MRNTSQNSKINLLPGSLQGFIANLQQRKIPMRVVFVTVSLLATIWFLVRVIPKPSRASYPCMRTIAPIMSGFVVWLITLSASWLAFRKAKNWFIQSRYFIAGALALLGVFFAIFLTTQNLPFVSASNVETWYLPNIPVGVARGIHPGQVVWAHNPKIASWDGKTGYWWEDRYINQIETDKLLDQALLEITGEETGKEAWEALFIYFNLHKGNSKQGYQKGEKIAIKINQNNTYSHANSPEINTTPQLVLSMLNSLVNDAGLAQEDIIVFDASRFITDNLFNKCHAIFPNVTFIDNIGGNGRIKTEYDFNALPYTKDNGRLANGLAKCAIEATYLINMAVLKGHVGQGTTLCAKNFYGVTSIHADWHKNVHNNFDQDREGKDRYMTFTDFMGHKDLGEKTMLFLVDAIYACKYVAGNPELKMQMPPFNNNWPNSLFVSQDGVAIDAVGMDFVLNEWSDAPDLKYCDKYLIEAAMANNPPSGTIYDPERDGTRLTSLGTFEHWNNSIEKKYSRNLGKAEGIELVYKKIE